MRYTIDCLLGVCLLGIVAAFALTNIVSAQEMNQQCLKNVTDICGDADAGTCFENQARWQSVIPECVGEVQTLVEMANEAKADMLLEGASWGGKIRSGPGTNFKQVGSLAEGDLVMLEENTGVMFNGYPWFKISRYDSKTGSSIFGYQWGGIVCSFDERPGVFGKCPLEWSDNPARLKQSGIAQDPIAPAHGNSDEDNEMIDTQAAAAIIKCLDGEKNEGRDGSACISKYTDECLENENNFTTIAMRQCIGIELGAWDKMLNADYQKLMASLDTDAKKTSLRDAQRLWNKFINSFCPLAYEFNQGTMYLVSGDQCVMEMTARQDIELRKLHSNSL